MKGGHFLKESADPEYDPGEGWDWEGGEGSDGSDVWVGWGVPLPEGIPFGVP